MTSTDLMNVNAFENQLPDAAFAALNPQDESLADGIGQSYGVIGYKGKVWTLRYRGETYTFTRPDDGSPAAFLDVIVLRSASYRSKSWYEDGFQDGQSTGKRPTCASIDGVTPDSDVLKAQAGACALCPKNEFKQNANGRKGKDCSDYKRLAVLLLPAQSARLFGGAPLLEPVFLRVPAASLNDLATLGEAMSRKGFHYATYITRIGFDVEKPHPQMTFRALQKLTEGASLVMQLREDPQAYRITGENEIGKAKPAPAQVSAPGAAQPQVQTVASHAQQSSAPVAVPATTVRTADVSQDEVAKLEAQLAAAKAAAQSKVSAAEAAHMGAATQHTMAVQHENAAVDTGFASGMTIIPPAEKQSTGFDMVGLGASQPMVEVAQNTSPLVPTPTTTAADTDVGPAEESDADLDARIAALLPR